MSIETSENTCGGRPRVAGTRIEVYQVYDLVEATDVSTAADELNLSADEVRGALDYYKTYEEEMEEVVRAEKQAADELKARSLTPS